MENNTIFAILWKLIILKYLIEIYISEIVAEYDQIWVRITKVLEEIC